MLYFYGILFEGGQVLISCMRIASINKAVAMLIVIACFSMMCPSFISTLAEAEASNLFAFFNHSCEGEMDSSKNSSTEDSPCCSLPCNATACCVLMVVPKTAMIDIPKHSTKTNVICSERFNENDIISAIFKPPKR